MYITGHGHQTALDAIAFAQITPASFRSLLSLTHFGVFSPGSIFRPLGLKEVAPFPQLPHPRSFFPRLLSPPSMSSNNPQKIVYASARNLVTDGFYPLLLSNVHAAAPDLPLDPVIFRSLLLSILSSGSNNLLLRCSEEDLSLVQNITALVSAFHRGPDERHVSIPWADRGIIDVR